MEKKKIHTQNLQLLMLKYKCLSHISQPFTRKNFKAKKNNTYSLRNSQLLDL